jgi:hypothetical protein
MTNKVWTREEVQHNIHTNYKWLARAVLALYQRQTDDEKRHKTTISRNGIGFTGCDAKYMSQIAQQLLAGRVLTTQDQYKVRHLLKKYAGQLTRIANTQNNDNKN